MLYKCQNSEENDSKTLIPLQDPTDGMQFSNDFQCLRKNDIGKEMEREKKREKKILLKSITSPYPNYHFLDSSILTNSKYYYYIEESFLRRIKRRNSDSMDEVIVHSSSVLRGNDLMLSTLSRKKQLKSVSQKARG